MIGWKRWAPGLLLCALAWIGGGGMAQGDEPSSTVPLADDPGRVARDVYQEPEFWWKHRVDVQDPLREVGFFERLWDVIVWALKWTIEAIFRCLRWLFRQLKRLSPSEFGTSNGRPLLWGVVLLAVGIVVWYAIVWLRGRKRGEAAANLSIDLSDRPERLPDALLLLERARSALAADDYGLSLRFGFLAVLAALQGCGLLRYDRSRTNGEYYRDLRPAPNLAGGFREIALPFDRARYGRLPPARRDAEQAIALCESCLTMQGASE